MFFFVKLVTWACIWIRIGRDWLKRCWKWLLGFSWTSPSVQLFIDLFWSVFRGWWGKKTREGEVQKWSVTIPPRGGARPGPWRTCLSRCQWYLYYIFGLWRPQVSQLPSYLLRPELNYLDVVLWDGVTLNSGVTEFFCNLFFPKNLPTKLTSQYMHDILKNRSSIIRIYHFYLWFEQYFFFGILIWSSKVFKVTPSHDVKKRDASVPAVEPVTVLKDHVQNNISVIKVFLNSGF